MPAILTEPPAPGTYTFVLRRYDRDLLEHAIAFPCYDGSFDSRWIEFEGRAAHTLFVNTEPQRDRARYQGWKDETDRWFASLVAGTVRAKVEAVVRSIASPSTLATIAKLAGSTVEEATPIVAALVEAGVAIKRGTGAVVLYSAAPQAPPPDAGVLASGDGPNAHA